jgi:hypothetical protein
MNRRVVRLLIAAAAAILSASCTPGGGAIYWTLENEVKVSDSSLPNDVTFFDVTKIVSTGTYYAAAGKIWTVPDSAAEWDVNVTLPGPHSDDLCNALVASPFGTTTLYGGFINQSGSLGLYESTAAPTFDGQAAVADPDVADAQIALLKIVAHPTDKLAAVTARQPSAGASFQFGIVTSSDGTSFSVLDITRAAGEAEKPINDVIYSSRLAVWFVTEGTKLYTGAASPLTLDTMTNMTAGEQLCGVFDDGTNIYVASKAGAVYHSATGGTWTRIEAPTVSGAHPPLTRFADPLIETGILLVGSEGYGYYTLPTVPAPGSLERFTTTTIPLHAATVTKFFHDDGKDRVFAATSMGGLWRGTVAVSDGSIGWAQE